MATLSMDNQLMMAAQKRLAQAERQLTAEEGISDVKFEDGVEAVAA